MICIREIIPAAIVLSIAICSAPATALTTSVGQVWDTEPDAWTRGNTADTAWFGWDLLELPVPPIPDISGSYFLDDSTPDLGVGTTAANPRLAQSAASKAFYGHQSASGNYYSGFAPNMLADDEISGVAPASGTGGFTTLLLQIIESPGGAPGGQPADDSGFETMTFSLPGWTLSEKIYGENAAGFGLHWIEWTAPGADLQFNLRMNSTVQHIAIDAIQIDTHWTSGSVPVVNTRSSIGIPEPATGLMALLVAVGGLLSRCRQQVGR